MSSSSGRQQRWIVGAVDTVAARAWQIFAVLAVVVLAIAILCLVLALSGQKGAAAAGVWVGICALLLALLAMLTRHAD